MSNTFLAAVTAAALLGGCAADKAPSAAAAGAVAIPPVAIEGARAAPGPLAATLTLPPGAGPHPVVILLHGCGGPSSGQRLWVDRLEGWGYGSLLLDSFSARGVKTVCAPAMQQLVTGSDRSADVIAAARWLQGVPGVDGERLAVLGESHGGGTAMRVASGRMEASENGLIKGVVNYYGPCRDPASHGTVPVLALAGTDDTWGNPVKTCAAYAAAVAGQQPVTVQAYAGVVHGFDNPGLVNRRWAEGHPLQYDQKSADDSFRQVHAFLAAVIGRGR